MLRNRAVLYPIYGAVAGASLSAWLAIEMLRVSPQYVRSHVFDLSTFLYVVSLPWSVPIDTIGITANRFLEYRGAANSLSPHYWAMPIIAGAIWGVIAAWLRNRFARSNPSGIDAPDRV